MNRPPDYRDEVYRRYLDRPDPKNDNGYQAVEIPDAFGDALYAPALIGVSKQYPVLELGAGAGHLLEYLSRRGFTHVYGVDLCEPLVADAIRRGIRVHAGNAYDLLKATTDNSLGAVIAVDVVEHLTKSEIIEWLVEIFRCLRPGGVLLIQTVNGQGLFPGQIIYGDVTHTTILNPGSLSHLLGMSGFAGVTFRESVYFGPGRKAFIRSWAWRLIRCMANFCRWVEAGKRQDIWSENMICRAIKPQQESAT